jgi:hypothetical protein
MNTTIQSIYATISITIRGGRYKKLNSINKNNNKKVKVISSPVT